MKCLITSSINRLLILCVTLLIFGLGIMGCSKSQELQDISEDSFVEGVAPDEVRVDLEVKGGVVMPPEDEAEIPFYASDVPDQTERDTRTSKSDLEVASSDYGAELKPKTKPEIGKDETKKGASIPAEIVPLEQTTGFYLSDEIKFTEEVGKKWGDAKNFSRPCNVPAGKDWEPRNVVSQLNAVVSDDGILQLTIGCEDVGWVRIPGSSPNVLPPVPSKIEEFDHQYTIRPPVDFALAGFYAQTCREGTYLRVGSIIPYAKKVNRWGINDDVLWASPRISASSHFDICKWELYLCPKNFVLSGIYGQFYKPLFEKDEYLNLLRGSCHKVVNDEVAKPKVESVSLAEPEKIEAVSGESDIACSLSCRDNNHPNGVVVGFEASLSSAMLVSMDSGGALNVITGMRLLCKDVTTEGLQPKGSEYRKTALCGNDYSAGSKGWKRVVIFPKGFVTNGIYFTEITGGFGYFPTSFVGQFQLYGTPLDVFDYGQPVNGDLVVLSPKAGSKFEDVFDKKCEPGKVMTGITFSRGIFKDFDGSNFPLLFGTYDFTCAGVDRKFAEVVEGAAVPPPKE